MGPLLFTPEQHERALKLVGEFSLRYLATVAERPVYPPVDRVALRTLKREPLPRRGQALETLFAELEQVVVPNSTHTAHPRFLPYVQPSFFLRHHLVPHSVFLPARHPEDKASGPVFSFDNKQVH
jgi:hypothetical protein